MVDLYAQSAKMTEDFHAGYCISGDKVTMVHRHAYNMSKTGHGVWHSSMHTLDKHLSKTTILRVHVRLNCSASLPWTT